MSKLTPEQAARQWVGTITGDGGLLGVAFGYDRIVKKWTPEQADELKAVGRLMVELAEKLRSQAGGER